MRIRICYLVLGLCCLLRTGAQPLNHSAGRLLEMADSAYASNPDSSYAWSSRAATISLAAKDNLSLARAKVFQGRYLLLKSKLDDANRMFNEALKLFEAMHDLSGTANVYRLKSILQKRIGNAEEALRLIEESIRISSETGDKRGELTGLMNAFLDYTALHHFDKAQEALRRIEAYMPEMADHDKYYYFQNKGIYNMALEKYALAIPQFLNALDIARKQRMIDSEATILMKLGNAYRLNLDAVNARKYLLESEAVCLKNNLDHELIETYDELILLSQQTGNYAMAFNYLKVKTELRDKIITIEKLNKINELEKKLALTEKQKELDNEKLNVQNARLQSRRLLYFLIFVGAVAILIVFLFLRTRSLKNKIEEKSFIIEEKQKEILDSIHYARRIQNTLLVHRDVISHALGEHFIFYKPKDIVSGDFYWAAEKNGASYLAVCDSTGHGVPGAFMSLLNINFLNEAINEKGIADPAQVFNRIRRQLIENMSQQDQKDGMDGVLLKYDRNHRLLTYTAAYNAPLLVSRGQAFRQMADKMPVGKGEKTEDFSTYSISANPGDMLYLFTDGYADQFGGPRGKKFKYKQLEELLVSISGLAPEEQSRRLDAAFEAWRGQLEQVDDVLVIGLKM